MMVDVKYRNDRIRDLEAENARLRGQVERLQSFVRELRGGYGFNFEEQIIEFMTMGWLELDDLTPPEDT